LLVDGNQNVDRDTYEDIVRNIGFENFVLEILGNVVNRNPFKNQYELNRNLDEIAEKIKKSQEELQKKQKVLDRREEKIKTAEEQLLTICKQKIISL
jgi:septal ring factor EnvC (AmiA/AmiB activator)